MKTPVSKSLRLLSTFWVALWASAAIPVAADQVAEIAMVPRLTIKGTPGATNQVQYCTNLSQPDWVALTNLVVTETNYWFVDVGAPPAPRRFYRVLVLAPSGTVLIPAGSFTMGDSLDGYGDALPLHTVYVSAFYMDRYQVTKALWDEVKDWNAGNGYAYDNAGSGKATNHPTHTVNWYDVVKWCNARSQKEELEPCYYTDSGLTVVYKTGQVAPYVKWTANGYRLPTEAEREKAARGGAAGGRFSWSDANTIDWSRANYSAYPGEYSYDVNPISGYNPAGTNGGYPYTSPVGSFPPNGYGLYDMAGNVVEWCWDWYDGAYYSSSPVADPRGAVSGLWRVLRGGAWYYSANVARCAYRVCFSPTSVENGIGFRCVRGL